VVVSETLHAVTYPHPVEAEPSIVMLVAVDVEDEEVVDEVAGLRASTVTPKSFPCVLPNDNVAEVIELERTSY
jgi:hypothetical protein